MKSRGLEALNYLYNDLRLMKCLGVVEEVKVKSAYECLKQTLLKAQELEKENKELIKKADCCLWKDCNKISQENQELKKAIKKAIELLSIDGKGTKKQVLNLLKEVLEE